MRETREIATEYGQAKVPVCTCEGCGAVTTHTTSSFSAAKGWYLLSHMEPDRPGQQTAFDYCSIDCMIGNLIPDIYSTDPAAVSAAIGGLKRIESSLGQKPV